MMVNEIRVDETTASLVTAPSEGATDASAVQRHNTERTAQHSTAQRRCAGREKRRYWEALDGHDEQRVRVEREFA